MGDLLSEPPCVKAKGLTVNFFQLSVYYYLRKLKENPNFFRHMGRCIYGGIYDPKNENNLIDENRFRTDVIDCMKELKVPVVRYPGGNFVATYRWQDGVGPREKRPKRPELAWLGTESNQFGTDEFMLWCEKIGAEPYLALNMGTGTLEDGKNAMRDSTESLQLISV